jgi:dTDP-4-amino-4,6-dideoxygalactose transaminase
MINVTKTFLPDFEEYAAVLKRSWDRGWITNNGELVRELEEKLKQYLGVPYLLFCNNGTTVLQMALRAFDITGEVLTTPFSYVATTNAILWERCKPVFVDIDERHFGIDADKLEGFISDKTQAILATHVYGYPLDVEKIEVIARKRNLKVIYDGAHAFGCELKNRSLLYYGDVSTCSFHATKLFHTVEGGCIVCHDDETYKKLFLFRQFGHIYDDYISVGINGKNSEFHAAMGLVLLPKIDYIIERRKYFAELYDSYLLNKLIIPNRYFADFKYNYGYYPVLFDSEEKLMLCKLNLEKDLVFARRYFYPSLNELSYVEGCRCPISENISRRILCLPLFPELTEDIVQLVSSSIVNTLYEL